MTRQEEDAEGGRRRRRPIRCAEEGNRKMRKRTRETEGAKVERNNWNE